MKIKSLLFACALLLGACSTLTPTQGVLLTDAVTLAQSAATAAAQTYAPAQAGPAASAGLNALASVLQGYIGSKVPGSVVAATPGIAGLGAVASSVISTKGTVTQADVNAIYQAASIALAGMIPAPGTPAASGTTSQFGPRDNDSETYALVYRPRQWGQLADRLNAHPTVEINPR